MVVWRGGKESSTTVSCQEKWLGNSNTVEKGIKRTNEESGTNTYHMLRSSMAIFAKLSLSIFHQCLTSIKVLTRGCQRLIIISV